MNICVQMVLNTVKTVKGHINQVLTIGNYLPDTLACFAAMLCTLSCGYGRCTECHAIYFKPMFLPFLSYVLIIIVA